MVSHQNGPVLTVSPAISRPRTHLQPPSLFLWPPSMSSVRKTASPVRRRNINGRLIWHKISPFGPALRFFTDNKNYSLSPCVPLRCSLASLRGERHIYWGDGGGAPGEQNCCNQCYPNKAWGWETLDWAIWLLWIPPGAASHKLGLFHVSVEQWIWENVVWVLFWLNAFQLNVCD